MKQFAFEETVEELSVRWGEARRAFFFWSRGDDMEYAEHWAFRDAHNAYRLLVAEFGDRPNMMGSLLASVKNDMDWIVANAPRQFEEAKCQNLSELIARMDRLSLIWLALNVGANQINHDRYAEWYEEEREYARGYLPE